MKNRAVIYARYSSHSQNEQSIETQVNICKSYAKKNKLNIVNVYSDKAKTGTNDNREAFQQMLSDSSKKTFDYVLVYNLSRFARNSTESVMNEMILSKNGVSVISATESVNGDDDDPIASLMKNIMRGVNEYYSKNTAKNIRDGLRTNARKGLSIGGLSLPLGYKSNEHKEIIIDEETAPFVRKIFEMYHEHSSMADIVRYLNANGIKTSRGNEFNKNSILRIVTNKKYIGIYTFKGEEMPVRIPSIIDKEIFNEDRPIYTKTKDEGPTHYSDRSNVINSIIANGCRIEGTVENCIIGRRVYVGKNTKLKDCIIMQNSNIDDDAVLDNVIADKGSEIRKGETLIGSAMYPLVIKKKK